MSLGHEAVSKRCVLSEMSPDDSPDHDAPDGGSRDFEAERQAARERRRAERRRLLASGPPSPCVSVCQMDPLTGYCVGCLRTIDEIRDWIISTPDERQKILDVLPGRKERSGL
jgi:predicted Fe-S protein YdhL (DUF1289 family)